LITRQREQAQEALPLRSAPRVAWESTHVKSAALPWYRQISRTQWNTLIAAQVGYLLDAMDVMLYAFALTTLKTVFGLGNAQAGLLQSMTLVASAVGGISFGIISDRVGRTRALMATILIYAVASGGTATAHSIPELLAWRTLIG